jgi:DNA polymerase-4
MDAFYASIEQRDNPDLRGKPIAVGRGAERGVVAAASYEARKYGVRSAMPSLRAKRLCPHLIFVRHRFDVYRQVSSQIREIFLSYTDIVEPLSLDEAYLDVTYNKIGLPSATLIAERIRRDVFSETGLTASAGVSYNKFLAKIASDVNKPNGMTVITPDEARAFLASLPVGKFFGVGPATEKKMKNHGLLTGRDLASAGEEELVRLFGKTGKYFHGAALGIDNREVHPHRRRKSLGGERTFELDLRTEAEMLERLEPITQEVADGLAKLALRGRTVTLKFKYADFEQHTRSHSISGVIHGYDSIWALVRRLLTTPGLPERPVRLLGVTVSNFVNDEPGAARGQMTLQL